MMAAEQPMSSVVTVRLDAQDHIRSADELILRLQAAAGGDSQGRIAVPQIASVARLARRLGLLIARPLLIGGQDYDIRLWVRARPVADGVEMEFSEWQEAPHADADAMAAQRAAHISLAPDGAEWRTDAQMRFLYLGAEADIASPGDEFFATFSPNSPAIGRLAAEVSARRAFYGMLLTPEKGGGVVSLSGHPLFDADGSFLGYRGKLSVHSEEGRPALAGVTEKSGAGRQEPGPGIGLPDFGRRLDLALRQPLGRIIANAETIRSQLDGPLRSDYTSYAADIANAGRHLMELVDDLADLQAIDRVGFHVAQEEVDLADMARRAKGLLGVKATDRGIRIEVPGPENTAPAIGEFRRALQIIVNLLTNAIRYSPEGTIVRLAAHMEDGRAVLSITDQGPGIAPEDRERVFEKFERLGRNDVVGSGLGLYISRRLARAMGGDIVIESGENGQGARFILSLPGWPK